MSPLLHEPIDNGTVRSNVLSDYIDELDFYIFKISNYVGVNL